MPLSSIRNEIEIFIFFNLLIVTEMVDDSEVFQISGKQIDQGYLGCSSNTERVPGDSGEIKEPEKMTKLRNNIGFWILGLCNNYGYVIMLSAALDIISKNYDNEEKKSDTSDEAICNPMSTGAILIADIIPSLVIKLASPVIPWGSNIRVALVVGLSVLSYIMTALSTTRWVSFLGVICASASSGLGEPTFLSFSSRFGDGDTVSFWSSGTGGAGLIGSISYAGLVQLGLTPRTTLLIMLVVPVFMAITFWFVLSPPKIDVNTTTPLMQPHEPSPAGDEIVSQQIIAEPEMTLTFKEKTSLMKGLLRFMIPLALVYYSEYLINQALFELVYFPGIWLSHKAQYRWYQVDYQLGVLISRSSVKWIKIKALWLLPILQSFNLVLIFVQVLTKFLPNIWIMLLIVFYEGLLGGASYVNTFDQIYRKYENRVRGFCLGAASIADAVGITLSGFSSVLLHNILCDYISRH